MINLQEISVLIFYTSLKRETSEQRIRAKLYKKKQKIGTKACGSFNTPLFMNEFSKNENLINLAQHIKMC